MREDCAWFGKKQLRTLLGNAPGSRKGESDNNGVIKERDALNNKLVSILYTALDRPEWHLEHFLTLIAGFNFWPKVIGKMRKHTVTEDDVKDAICTTFSDLSNNLRILKNKKLESAMAPIFCLEAAIKNGIKIPPGIVKIIRLHRFNLYYKIVNGHTEYRKPRGNTYNIDQAKAFLNERLKRNLSRQNILEMCVNGAS